MRKVLLVARASGFVPQHEKNHVEILKEMGYEVHYAANQNDVVYGKDNRRLEETGMVLHQIDFPRAIFSKEIPTAYRQLKDLMLAEEFDMVHCHMPGSSVLARKAAEAVRKQTGRFVPVLYTVHGFHFFRGAPLRNWLYYPVERHMARYTDKLITINDEDYHRAQHFPVRGAAEYIPGVGIDLERFLPYRKKTWEIERFCKEEAFTGKNAYKTDIRSRFGIPPDFRILVSVGELSPRKNHLLVLEAMKELGDLKLAYLLCGTGRMENALRQKAKELQIENRVFFSGYVEEIPQLLQQCDCFVFPSYREGLPVALMEAMAVGLPVIASDIRGNHDLIEHTKGGYLIKSFAPEEYAVKIRRMFTEKEGKSAVPRAIRRQQMGDWNTKRIQAFAEPVVAKEVQRIYSDVLRKK